MHWIIDHLAAFVVGCTIIFMLAVMQLRGQSASIDAVQFSAARATTNVLTQVLEQDVANIGAGMFNPASAQLAVDTVSSTRSLSFFARTDRNSAQVQRIEYRWEEDGEVEIQGEVVPRYSMSRIVNGTESPLTGNYVTSFGVTLRNEKMEPIYSPSAEALARTMRIDISLTLVSPLGKADLIEETRWQRSIIPLNLKRRDGTILVQG